MHERSYFTYILASKSRTLYIGVTGDLPRRILQHKQKTHSGFTARYNCNRLVWFERFTDAYEAIQREKELKGWIRARKTALIESANPTWEDLSESWFPHLASGCESQKADPSLPHPNDQNRVVGDPGPLDPQTIRPSAGPRIPLRSG